MFMCLCETERGRGNERERQREQESKKGLYATVTTDILEFSTVRIFSILPRGLPGLEKLHDTQHTSTMRINAETGSTRLCSSPPLSKIVRKSSVQRRVCVCVCVCKVPQTDSVQPGFLCFLLFHSSDTFGPS